ncbi:MAG: hypothetical protein ACRDPG_02540 [Nocardioidaceae bacterium]
MDSEHKKYDNPEPQQQTRSKGVIYLLGALVVVLLLVLIATGKVGIRG